MGGSNCTLMTDYIATMGIPQSIIAGIYTSKDLANKQSIRSHCQVQRRSWIPQNIDSKRNTQIQFKFAYYSAHCGHSFAAYICQIWQTKLIGKHHRIYSAILKRVQIFACFFHNPFHPFCWIIIGIPWQCLKMTHGNNCFFCSNNFFEPTHENTLSFWHLPPERALWFLDQHQFWARLLQPILCFRRGFIIHNDSIQL